MDLLAERLNDIADKMRHAITPTIIKIIEGMRHILSTASEVEQTGPALRAFEAVSKTLSPGEESAVAAAVTTVTRALRDSDSRPALVRVVVVRVSLVGPAVSRNAYDPDDQQEQQEKALQLEQGL